MLWHFLQIAIAIDQLMNTLLGGWCDETLSSRAWRLRNKTHFFVIHKVIDTILFFDPHHCEMSYLAERNSTQEPPELR